jgi:hypothetical protein
MSYLLQLADSNSRKYRVTAIWDLNPEFLILASLSVIISGRIRACVAVAPALSLAAKFKPVGDVAGFQWSSTPESDSLVSSPNVSIHRQSPSTLDMRPIIPLSCSTVTCPVHLNKVGTLDPYIFRSYPLVFLLVPQAAN